MKIWITGGAAVAAVTAATVAVMTSGQSTTAHQAANATPASARPAAAGRAAAPMSILTPSAYKLKFRGQFQQTNYYCVPSATGRGLGFPVR